MFDRLEQLRLALGIRRGLDEIFANAAIVLDPFKVRVTLASGAHSAATQITDQTANELYPLPAGSNGVLKSKGTSSAFTGYIYALGSHITGAADGDDVNLACLNCAVGLQSGGRQREVSLGQLVRIQPHYVTGTAAQEAATCGAPGTPSYVFPGEAPPWDGLQASLFGTRDQASYTLAANLALDVEVWGCFAQTAQGQSVVQGRECRPKTDEDLLRILQAEASVRAAVLQGAPIVGGWREALTLLK